MGAPANKSKRQQMVLRYKSVKNIDARHKHIVEAGPLRIEGTRPLWPIEEFLCRVIATNHQRKIIRNLNRDGVLEGDLPLGIAWMQAPENDDA